MYRPAGKYNVHPPNEEQALIALSMFLALFIVLSFAGKIFPIQW